MAKLVIACHVYINDDWYGDRHRVILTKENGEGFANKTEAKKFTVRLRKYTQELFSRSRNRVEPITNDNIRCADLIQFPEYTHVSFGPSLSYKHHTITTADLSK
jgi:hypothetical protein